MIGLVHSRHKRLFLAVSVALAVTGVLLGWQRSTVRAPEAAYVATEVSLADQQFTAYIADTPAKRQEGLANFNSLQRSEAMLFVFDDIGRHCFWMKGVEYPIDILWFSADYELVHVINSLPPESYPESFCPTVPAKYVLELPAGTAERLGIELGTVLEAENLNRS